MRFVWSLALLPLLSSPAPAPGPVRDGGPVSGKVTVIEKEGATRALVRDLLVYIDGVEAPVAAPAGNVRKPTIASHNKTFEPHVEAIPVGTAVSFPNLDDIMHNVFSLTKGNRFDLGLYKSGAKKDFVFENPGLVRIYCNIHPQMSAFVLVMDNPHYAWAGPDGSFRIEGVPPGSYTLKVWHEEGETEQPIVVTERGASGLEVELDVSDFKKRPHLNKFGKPYKKRGKY